ncbi:MAG: hypothetical protein WB471_12050 [Nocardioides sp.]
MLPLVAALLLATGPAPGAGEEFSFADPAIIESSGLVVDAVSGLFVTTNDSGDEGRLFVVDPSDGTTVGLTRWRASTGQADPVDVEALAPAGPGAVWVGDIGDNDGVRDSVRLFRVPVGRGTRDVVVDPYELIYPDGARDAESLLLDPRGRVLVVTKGLFGGEVLRSEQPLTLGRPAILTQVGDAWPLATDAAFFPDGRHLIVRSYGSAAIYSYPALRQVGEVGLPDQQQGEGVAVDAAGQVFLSSEGEGSQVLRVPLPAPSPSPPPQVSDPAPAPPTKATDPVWWRGGLGGLGLGGLLGLGVVVVLLRTLRPRG